MRLDIVTFLQESHMSFKDFVFQAASMLLALALMALAAGCGGGAAEQAGPAAAQSQAPGQQTGATPGLPALPAPELIARGASVIEGSLVLNGSSFRTDLTHQNVSSDGEVCVYDPSFLSGDNPQYSQVALAIYSFDISSASDAVLDAADLDLDGLPDLVIGTTHAFAGVPSLDQKKWDWGMLHKSSSSSEVLSWSWGASNPGSLRARSPKGVLQVCVVVYGDTALDVSRVALRSPQSSTGLVMQELFRKGWDIKKNEGARRAPSSVSLDCDDTDRVHAACFDSGNGQLYYFQCQGRSVTEVCADCDADCGSSCDLALSPDGGLLLAYTDDNLHQGACKLLSPDQVSSFDFSQRSYFDTGDDGSGKLDAVGSSCRCVFDAQGAAHVFYLDSSSGRVKHASRLNGLPPGAPWTVEFVSPPNMRASCPAPVVCPSGVCCVYILDPDGDPATGNALELAQQGADNTWSSRYLVGDVTVPSGDPDEDCDGYCDAGAVPGANVVTCVYSSSSGFSALRVDPATSKVMLRESPTRASTGGSFVRCAALADGSVRVAHYDNALRTIFFATGLLPDGSSFSELPAVQYDDGKDEDCDGLDFWVDQDADNDGFHQVVLVDLSSKTKPASGANGEGKKEYVGHVTLMK
jgi:hypothetical protein